MKSIFENWRKYVRESITLDIKVGDILLGGKYKNKRIVIKSIGKDENGQTTINGKPLLNYRIEKQLPDNKKSKKTQEEEKDLKESILNESKTNFKFISERKDSYTIQASVDGELVAILTVDEQKNLAGCQPDIDHIKSKGRYSESYFLVTKTSMVKDLRGSILGVKLYHMLAEKIYNKVTGQKPFYIGPSSCVEGRADKTEQKDWIAFQRSLPSYGNVVFYKKKKDK
jgi:hypothetical protein